MRWRDFGELERGIIHSSSSTTSYILAGTKYHLLYEYRPVAAATGRILDDILIVVVVDVVRSMSRQTSLPVCCVCCIVDKEHRIFFFLSLCYSCIIYRKSSTRFMQAVSTPDLCRSRTDKYCYITTALVLISKRLHIGWWLHASFCRLLPFWAFWAFWASPVVRATLTPSEPGRW